MFEELNARLTGMMKPCVPGENIEAMLDVQA